MNRSIEVEIAEGNPNRRTKESLKIRKENVVVIGKKVFSPPKTIKKNEIALKKWKEIMILYSTAATRLDITSNADVGLLERYCLSYYDFHLLAEAKRHIVELHTNDLVAALTEIERLKIDQKMASLNRLLLSMDTELFLTPLSKRKAIPIDRETPGRKKLKARGFGNI